MSTEDDAPADSETEHHDRAAEAEPRDLAAEVAELRVRLQRVENALAKELSRRHANPAERDPPLTPRRSVATTRQALDQETEIEARAAPSEALGPAISRWRRRRGAGPRGVKLAEDFDAPLPEFRDY